LHGIKILADLAGGMYSLDQAFKLLPEGIPEKKILSERKIPITILERNILNQQVDYLNFEIYRNGGKERVSRKNPKIFIKFKKMKFIILLLSGLFISLITLGQETSDTIRKDALRVFMYASDYIKQEIPFINYVRDLKDAQVYIISTTQPTGAGGTEYSYLLIGQQEFEGMRDTITFSTSPDDTQEQSRQKEVSTLKMALMRYIVKTPLGKYISIDFTVPIKEEVTTDKWKNWVFELRANGYMNGEKSYNSNTYFGSLSIKKITEQWKIGFGFDYSNRTDKYVYDEETYKYNYSEKTFTALMVKSKGEHWGIGFSSSASQSTYGNYDLRILLMPGIEFNALDIFIIIIVILQFMARPLKIFGAIHLMLFIQ
jgi:hypothetical protein